MPRSCRRSSTLRSESGNRTYSITAKRMVSGLVLKYLNGEHFVICRFFKYSLLASTDFNLTVPIIVLVRSFYDILSYGGAYNQGRFVASSFSNASMILRFSIVRSIGDSPCSSMRRASPRISNRKLSCSTFTVLWAKSTSI